MSTAAIKASSTVLDWSERGLVPDSVIRAGIRRLCRQRLFAFNDGSEWFVSHYQFCKAER